MMFKYPVRADRGFVVDADGQAVAMPSAKTLNLDQAAIDLAAEMNRGKVWEPIETAPQHEFVRVRSRDGNEARAAYGRGMGWLDIGDCGLGFEPTHWMPLPPPPKPEPEPEKQDEAVELMQLLAEANAFFDRLVVNPSQVAAWQEKVKATIAAREKEGA